MCNLRDDGKRAARKKQLDLFCKLLTREPVTEAFYLLALDKLNFDLPLIHEIGMKLLNNIHAKLEIHVLLDMLLKVGIFRVTSSPKKQIFMEEFTEQKLKSDGILGVI